MFTLQHTMCIPKSALIVFTCYRSAVSTDSASLSITNGAEIREIKSTIGESLRKAARNNEIQIQEIESILLLIDRE